VRLLKIAAVAYLLFQGAQVFSQQEIGLHFMRDVWQANQTNPAIVSPAKITIGLASVRNNLLFDGPTYNQIVSKQNGEPVIDIDRFIGYLNPENLIRDDLDFSTLSAAVRLGDLTLSLGHAVKYHAFFKYPKTLPQVVWQGNAQFVGQEVPLGNELQLTGYHELGLGAAYRFGNITLGAKAKFLSGIADTSTDPEHHDAFLYTDPDIYQITLKGDYILNTANAFDYNSYKDLDLDFNYGSFTFDNFFSKNSGVAFDFGARFHSDKWDVAASILDLGKIDWNTDVTNYLATKDYQYDGLDFSQALTGDETANFDAALDTLEALFQVEEANRGYTTDLPSKIYLSALYRLTDKWQVGGLLFHESFRGELSTTFAVGANATLLSFLTAGATYAISEDSYDNFGLNLGLALGPVQVFATTDNVVSLLNSGDNRRFSARVGANLVFGKGK
jgi:hypothetical protein